jgi:hypothetical protein
MIVAAIILGGAGWDAWRRSQVDTVQSVESPPIDSTADVQQDGNLGPDKVARVYMDSVLSDDTVGAEQYLSENGKTQSVSPMVSMTVTQFVKSAHGEGARFTPYYDQLHMSGQTARIPVRVDDCDGDADKFSLVLANRNGQWLVDGMEHVERIED